MGDQPGELAAMPASERCRLRAEVAHNLAVELGAQREPRMGGDAFSGSRQALAINRRAVLWEIAADALQEEGL